MKVNRVRLTDYRNYPQAELVPGAGITVLAGDNAQGKTNVLEAIYLCCTGRSHRTARDRELVRWGCGQARVQVDAEGADGAHDIDMRLFSDRRKQILVGGRTLSKLGELMGHVTGVLFSPEDLRLVKDGPEVRRRFVDMELSQIRPSYFYALQRYQRALLQRNRLLKDAAQSPALLNTLPDWDGQIASHGAAIARARHGFLEKLARTAGETHREISGGREELSVSYQCALNFEASASLEDQLLEMLSRSRDMDLRRGTTTVGPHRDDLQLFINGQDARAYGSQGQQRTAALSLKLSELYVMREETGEWPVLMLDDVMSELDPERRRMLLARLRDVQVLVSLTDLSDLGGAPAGQVYKVQGGAVAPL